jgi:phage gp36-like protein
MPYATQQDMIDRFGSSRLQQLTDIEEPLVGSIRTSVLAAKLADADAEIDGYLVGRYELPMAAWPAILKVHACSICWYRLLGSAADEPARRDYEDALAYLGKVARGDVVVVAASAAVPVSGIGTVLFDTGAKVFGRERC